VRPVLLAIALFALAACAQGPRRDSDCRPVKLNSFEVSRIRAAAKPQVATPLDLETQYVCRYRPGNWFRASFDTEPVPQPDGSERRHSLYCDSDYRRRTPWRCHAWREFRSVQVASPTSGSLIKVVIPPEMDGELARRDVSQAFSLLSRSGETNACPSGVEGMKTLPELRTDAEFAADTARALTSLRDSLIGAGHDIDVQLDPDGFALMTLAVNVHFVFPAPDKPLQVRCWSESVILVTS